jgi:DNA-binding GntR family transcriptional regulator
MGRSLGSSKKAVNALNAVGKSSNETQMMVVPITRQTVTHQATEALRERILRGVYADDTPLRQDALAAELGVSRIPIREALRQLEAEGLVVFNPHRGAVVSSLSVDEINELFELRAQIEGDLVRRAIMRTTAEHISRAREILKAYEAAFRGGEVAEWGKLNWEFHSTLYAAADRPFTMAIIQRLHQQSDRYLRMQLVLTHGESRAIDEHRAILAAVAAQDVKQACSLMRQHILGAGRQLVRFVSAEREAEESRPTKERRS